MTKLAVSHHHQARYITISWSYMTMTETPFFQYPIKKWGIEQIKTINKIYKYLHKEGVRPRMHTIDNECPEEVNSFLLKRVSLQLVSPNIHQTKKVEKSKGLFKGDFISSLATVHPDISLHLWCRLIPLSVTNLNLLRPSWLNPKLLAYELLEEKFDYNKTPIPPPVKIVLA